MDFIRLFQEMQLGELGHNKMQNIFIEVCS
jgi:hypothetical protein